MDVALSSALAQTQTQQQAATAVLKKSLSIAKQQGEAAVQLIESAAQVSANVASAGSACNGCGGKLDIRA